MFPYRLVDLTHTLDPNIPTWTGSCGFEHILKQDYHQAKTTPGFRVQQIKMHASAGTHIDAPSHCMPGERDVSQISLEDLCVPCIVINVAPLVATGDYTLPFSIIKQFEQQYRPQWKRSLVLIHTGWQKHWYDKERYTNNHVFPSISDEVGQYLAYHEIVGLGIDTLSPDKPQDGFPVHVAILGSGGYIIENICNADQMPVVGGYAIVAPIKTKEGAEAPVRLIGLAPY